MRKKQKPKSKGKSTKGIPGNKNERIKKRAELRAKAFTVPPGMEILIPKDDDIKIQRGLYSDEILPKLEELAAKGLNNAQIAQCLCIGNKTFYEWRARYPQFAHALSKYRGVADIMVENALFNTAIGFTYEEESMAPSGKVKTLKKYQPGSANAQKFYLVNRMQKRYKNKVETEISVSQDISVMAFAIKRRE